MGALTFPCGVGVGELACQVGARRTRLGGGGQDPSPSSRRELSGRDPSSASFSLGHVTVNRGSWPLSGVRAFCSEVGVKVLA